MAVVSFSSAGGSGGAVSSAAAVAVAVAVAVGVGAGAGVGAGVGAAVLASGLDSGLSAGQPAVSREATRATAPRAVRWTFTLAPLVARGRSLAHLDAGDRPSNRVDEGEPPR